MQFQQAKINLYHSNGRLGVALDENITPTGKIIAWNDPAQVGYFSREKEFVVEFSLAGRNFAYGKIEYRFMNGRSSLSVQDEVLLERIHDSISDFADKLRKENFQYSLILSL